MYYVYIIYSIKLDKFYKGKCSDLRSRIKQHNSGRVKSTKNGRPWKLLHYQAFVNKTDAGREELFLKTGKGRERIKYLLEETLKNMR